jgi:nucleoid DNA-binding protein
MNFEDLYKRVAEKEKIMLKDSATLIQSVLEEIAAEMSIPNRVVKLKGFGTFKSVIRRPKNCHNPHTGEKIKIGKKHKVVFKASKLLEKDV